MDPDSIYIGSDSEAVELWASLFKNHNIFEAARKKSIYFTIVGGEWKYYALIVYNGRERQKPC